MKMESIGHVVMPFAYLIAGVVLVIGITAIAIKALAIEGFEMLMSREA